MKWNKIVFYHLPKTGGLSLKSALQQHYNHVILDSYTFISYKSFYTFYEGTNEGQCKEPHKFIYVHDWTTQNPFSFITPKDEDFTFTIIRHPINLLYSLYFHLKRGDKEESPTPILHGICHQMIKSSTSVTQFIDWILDFGYIVKECILPVGYYNKEMLNKLKYIGIFEELSKTVQHLESVLNIQLDIPCINVGEYKRSFSYRYDELQEFFEKELDVYKYFLNKHQSI